MALLATVSSVVPFALWDMLALLLCLVLVVLVVRRIGGGKPLLPGLSRLLVLVSCWALLFVGWAFNHYAPSLASQIGLEVREYSADELGFATEHYLREAAARATAVPRNDAGQLAEQDFYELARIGGAAYAGLGKRYEVFQGAQTPVKALLLAGEPLLYSGHTGIFFAPTGESCVPLHCARADIPFIMCHEAAHRLAIASEAEANFAAFLACAESDDVRFAYSGYYNAFVYCYNALYGVSPDAAAQVLESVSADKPEEVKAVLRDLDASTVHYAMYEGPVQEVGASVNDGYLKSFGEEAGVQSYGLVVDDLIALFQSSDAWG